MPREGIQNYFYFRKFIHLFLKMYWGKIWWLIPVISATWKVRPDWEKKNVSKIISQKEARPDDTHL
jgi:hypothetical protein